MNRSNRPPKPRTMVKPDARRVALDVLQDVTCSDAYASLSLNKRLQESRMDARDREFVTTLVYGTLEHRMRLDYVLDAHLRDHKLLPLLRDLLRMSAYQLLFLDRVPEHAVVDEAVKITKAMMPHGAALINAVLRNLIRGKEDIRWPEDPVEYLSVYHSMPRWLVERFIETYGQETAEQIVAYRQPGHALTVRPNRMRLDAKTLERRMTEKGWQWKPGRVPEAYQVTGAGEIGRDEDFRNGMFSIQGESSMLAVQAVAPRNGWKVLDACAAPGGKSAYLAELMQGTGRVFAWDLHAHRVELIRGTIRRLGLENVRPAERDASVYRQDMEQSMDAVLIDAPCSGLGVMLDKPDVKYRQTPEGVAALTEIQRALLDTCCRYVRPGGILVYTTCTILPEENAGQIRAFLDRHPEFTLDARPIGGFAPQEAGLQLLAHREGMEGFYIARMIRGNA